MIKCWCSTDIQGKLWKSEEFIKLSELSYNPSLLVYINVIDIFLTCLKFVDVC